MSARRYSSKSSAPAIRSTSWSRRSRSATSARSAASSTAPASIATRWSSDAQAASDSPASAPDAPGGFEARDIDLHGHRVVYRIAGEGPAVLLIHGMINSSRHWREVALRLAGSHTVVAPDLIGHGDSATPRGDYSIGAHAASIRD